MKQRAITLRGAGYWNPKNKVWIESKTPDFKGCLPPSHLSTNKQIMFWVGLFCNVLLEKTCFATVGQIPYINRMYIVKTVYYICIRCLVCTVAIHRTAPRSLPKGQSYDTYLAWLGFASQDYAHVRKRTSLSVAATAGLRRGMGPGPAGRSGEPHCQVFAPLTHGFPRPIPRS